MTTPSLDYTPRGLVSAAIATLRDPRGMAARVMDERLPAAVLWTMLVTVVAVSVVLGQGSLIVATGGAPMDNPYLANPMVMWGLQLALLFVMVHAIHRIGRAMGGQGVFEDTLALVVWLQFVMACLQVVQTGALFILPPLADFIGIIGLAIFLWLLTHFTAAAHGFTQLGPVFLMILISAFGITFALSLLLAMLGIVVPGDFSV
jgi:hypothetical protein